MLHVHLWRRSAVDNSAVVELTTLVSIRQSGKSVSLISNLKQPEKFFMYDPLSLDEIPALKYKNHHLSRYVNRPWSCGEGVLPNSWLSCQISPFKSYNVTMHILELFSPNDFSAGFIQQMCQHFHHQKPKP